MRKLFAAVVLAAFSVSANAAIVQYDMTFADSGGGDGYSAGTNGTGVFFWDTVAEEMTSFTWDFGSGKTGGVIDTSGLTGQILFEAFTGNNVVAGQDWSVDSDGLGLSGGYLINPFPIGSIGFEGIYADSASEYRVNDGAGVYYRGTYSVSASAVPVPAAVWLFGSALAGLGWMKRKQTV